MSRAWYQLALSPTTPGGAGALVSAAGDHLGEALAAVRRAEPRRVVVAAQRAATAPLGESVGRRAVVPLGEHRYATAPLAWPAGVLPELESLPGLAKAAFGFAVHRPSQGVAVEAQVGAEQVVDVFLGLIEKLPTADNLEIKVMHHFDDVGQTEVWLSPRIGVRRVVRFLDAYDKDLLHSGLVELSVYVRQEQSTLRLTEHKTVLWLSRDASTEARISAGLRSLKVAALPSLVALSSVRHHHLRPEGSKDRQALVKLLEKQRMRRVDRLDPAGTSIDRAPADPAS